MNRTDRRILIAPDCPSLFLLFVALIIPISSASVMHGKHVFLLASVLRVKRLSDQIGGHSSTFNGAEEVVGE